VRTVESRWRPFTLLTARRQVSALPPDLAGSFSGRRDVRRP
jgi:hypothetical protein